MGKIKADCRPIHPYTRLLFLFIHLLINFLFIYLFIAYIYLATTSPAQMTQN